MTEFHFPRHRLAELSALLDRALELPEGERLAWVDALEGESAELAPLLRRLLDPSADGAPTSSSTWAPGAPSSDDDESAVFEPGGWEPEAGRAIGPYTLEQELGRGGMGVVWLAARSDGAYQRQVALKLPHRLLGRGRGRFHRERDILAALTHPNIAQFHDAGIDLSGQPYLALEWVVGEPITEACRARRSSLAERIALIRQVLDAVHYAHGRLIVHRDIKPTNVLVTTEGRVKLLDFGIAKLLERTDEPVGAPLTREGESVATPDYAAPEQLLAEPITVATDVYAIGILLFELLTGRRPQVFDGWASLSRLSTGSDDLPLASRRVAPDHAPTVGGLAPRALAKALAGDLDAILAKALAFKPADRYQSVEAFAADLDRATRNEPIVARRIGGPARAAKFVRRHRLGVVLGGALALAIAIGVIGVLWQAAETRREARRAEANKNFLLEIFTSSDPRLPSDRPRGEIKARELVDLAAARIDGDLRDDPLTRMELLDLTATIYLYLDEVEQAQRLVGLEVQAARSILPGTDSRLLDALLFQIWIDLQAGDIQAAGERLAALDRHLRSAEGKDRSRHRAEYWLALGDLALAKGDLVGREAALRQAAALFEEVAPSEKGYPATLANLGGLAFGRDELPAALAYFDRALQALESLGSATIEVARIESQRGQVLTELGRLDAAQSAYVAARAAFASTLGLDHITSWQATAGLGRLHCVQGRMAEAEALFASIPTPAADAGPGTRARYAQAEIQRGLCLATLPQRTADARVALEHGLRQLEGRSEYAADSRRATAALAALPRP